MGRRSAYHLVLYVWVSCFPAIGAVPAVITGKPSMSRCCIMGPGSGVSLTSKIKGNVGKTESLLEGYRVVEPDICNLHRRKRVKRQTKPRWFRLLRKQTPGSTKFHTGKQRRKSVSDIHKRWQALNHLQSKTFGRSEVTVELKFFIACSA